jgi:hypothetical protein
MRARSTGGKDEAYTHARADACTNTKHVLTRALFVLIVLALVVGPDALALALVILGPVLSVFVPGVVRLLLLLVRRLLLVPNFGTFLLFLLSFGSILVVVAAVLAVVLAPASGAAAAARLLAHRNASGSGSPLLAARRRNRCATQRFACSHSHTKADRATRKFGSERAISEREREQREHGERERGGASTSLACA